PDGSNATAQLVFKLTDLKGGSDGSGASYDADTETLTLKLDVTELRNYSDTIKGGAPTVLLASSDFQNLGTYVGQNAFGVKREISKSKLTHYRLVINNALEFPQSEKMGYGYTPDLLIEPSGIMNRLSIGCEHGPVKFAFSSSFASLVDMFT
ncbi:MAG: hypothetical protein ABI481_08985, partial [Pyrinomonadaceae bacterium]